VIAKAKSRVKVTRAVVGVERGVVSHQPGPHQPKHSGACGVMIPTDVLAQLLDAPGLPNIRSEPHGACATCDFGPRDRGYSWPCVSCGMGHPCHTPASPAGRSLLQSGDA
jgi:hypothetical protein